MELVRRINVDKERRDMLERMDLVLRLDCDSLRKDRLAEVRSDCKSAIEQ